MKMDVSEEFPQQPAPVRQVQTPVQSLQALKIGGNPQKKSVICVEISRINGNPITRDINYEEVRELWTRGLGRRIDELDGHVPFRHGGLARVNFKLKEPIDITTFANSPFLEFERHNGLGDTDVYTCKILDLESDKIVSAGDRVKVTVRHTHQAVPEDIINQWLGHYGQVVPGTTGLVCFLFLFSLIPISFFLSFFTLNTSCRYT